MAYTLQSKDVGVQLNLRPGSSVNLTGASLSFVVLDPSLTRTTHAATPSSDGTYATYTTTATDFPIGGTYLVQLIASFSAGARVISSPAYQLVVGNRI